MARAGKRFRELFDGEGGREIRANLRTLLPFIAEEIREGLAKADRELAAAGFDPPGDDIEAWCDLADFIDRESDAMTPAKIHRWAINWDRRENIKAGKLAKELAGLLHQPNAKLSTNERMLSIMAQQKELCISWTAEEWARRLDVSKASVVGSPAWRTIMAEREMRKSHRSDDGHT